jgi:hypothetical protein
MHEANLEIQKRVFFKISALFIKYKTTFHTEKLTQWNIEMLTPMHVMQIERKHGY